MAKINAMVIDHNIVGNLAAYKLRVGEAEVYCELIVRENPAQCGGIDERDALKIMNGDAVEITVEPTGFEGALEILDIKLLKDRPPQRRNLWVPTI